MREIWKPAVRDRKAEKIAFLQKYASDEWMKARQEADQEISDEHPMFCVCGKLCTGLHESYCQRFKSAVDTRAVEKLKDLWEEKKATFPKILEVSN